VVGEKKMAVYNDMSDTDRIRIHDAGVDPKQVDEAARTLPVSYRTGDIVSPYVPFQSRCWSRTAISSSACAPARNRAPQVSAAWTSFGCSPHRRGQRQRRDRGGPGARDLAATATGNGRVRS